MALFNHPLVQDLLFPSADGAVWKILKDGNTLYVLGQFTTIGGLPRKGIAAVDAITGAVLPTTFGNWDPGYTFQDALILGNTLYASGSFTGMSHIGGVAALDKTTGALLPWDPAPNGYVFCMATDGALIYMSGSFTQVNTGSVGVPASRNYIAAVNPTTGLVSGFDPGINSPCTSMLVEGNYLYMVGNFNTVNGGGTTRRGAAAVDLSTYVATAWDPDFKDGGGMGAPYALLSYNGAMYIGGSFSKVNNETVNRTGLVSVNPATGATNAAFDADLSGGGTVYFRSLLATNGQIVAGGSFLTAGGLIRNSVADFDPVTGAVGNLEMGTLVMGPPVFSLSTFGQKIYRGQNGAILGDGSDQLTAWWAVPPPPPPIREGTPEKPVISFLLRKDGQSLLKWESVTHDYYHNRIPRVDGYRVYRSTNKNLETYEFVKEIVSVDVRGDVDTMFSENIQTFYGYAVSAFIGPYEGEKAYVKATPSTFDLDLLT